MPFSFISLGFLSSCLRRTRLVWGPLCLLFPLRASDAQTPPAADAPVDSRRSIGVAFGPAEFEFTFITDVQFLPGDRLAVVDVGAPYVPIFSVDGDHLATLGRRGNGPGEFQAPQFLTLDSVLSVVDGRLNRVVTYTLDGEHVATTNLPTLPGHLAMRITRLSTGQLIAVTAPVVNQAQPGHETDMMVLRLRPGSGLDTLSRFHVGVTFYHGTGPNRTPWGGMYSRFGSGGWWATRDSVLAVADGYAGTVRFLVGRTDGSIRLLAVVKLPGASRAVRKDDLAEVETAIREAHHRTGRPLGRITLEPPPRWSIAQRAFFDARGMLWVLQGLDPDSSETWTVLTHEGVRFSWRFPARTSIMAASLPFVAGRRVSEDDIQSVILFRLRQ
jgi:hypothetical protein